jgi:hypothetical protein
MDRAERRQRTKVKQNKRIKNWEHKDWEPDTHHKGRMRKSHFGCGCEMCKPWKHKLDNKYKPSEVRELQDVEQDDI